MPSLGGMAATRASGTNAVRYGTMRENVLSLTAVMADGEVVTTGTAGARKSSAGYDLTRLLVGSEGTLGIITAADAEAHGIPQAISGGVCPFPSVEAACNAVIATIQMGIPVARIELVNALQMRAMQRPIPSSTIRRARACSSNSTAARPALRSRPRRFGEIAEEFGGGPFLWTTRRRGAHQAMEGPARRLLGVADAAAGRQGPVDRCLRADLAACRMRHRDRGRHRRDGPDRADRRPCRRRQFPRAGADRRRRPQGDRAGAKTFVARLNMRAIAMDGTCTGEHGIGQGKIGFLRPANSATASTSCATIKRALDPHDIINPGKILSHPRR